MRKITFSDNALHANHRTDKARQEIPWRHPPRNEGALKTNQNLFSLLQILSIHAPGYIRHRITERLSVLAWSLQEPAFPTKMLLRVQQIYSNSNAISKKNAVNLRARSVPSLWW